MPRNFSWLIQGEIAGMARPVSMVADLEFLKDNGIEAIVSLTEIPLHKTLIEEFGFEYKHIPVPDLASPTQEQIEEFVSFVNNLTTSKKKIVVHCDAGIGRNRHYAGLLSCKQGLSCKSGHCRGTQKKTGFNRNNRTGRYDRKI